MFRIFQRIGIYIPAYWNIYSSILELLIINYMKLTEINEIYATQKNALNGLELGIERQLLSDLPDIKSHALVISGIHRYRRYNINQW